MGGNLEIWHSMISPRALVSWHGEPTNAQLHTVSNDANKNDVIP